MHLYLITRATRPQGADFIRKLHQSGVKAGKSGGVSDSYKHCEFLFMYGMGGADRYDVALDHIKKGQTLVTFDIGYWQRKRRNRKFRASIDGLHCPKYIMRGPYPGPERWIASGMRISKDRECNGPILLVGNGPKSERVGAEGWTVKKALEIRARFPDRKILYKPKPQRAIQTGVSYDDITLEDIDRVLPRVSLVVCRHSNVAVDACRMGVPVVCEDGAGAAIYPSALDDYKSQPTMATREEFLHRLAWWQWTADELSGGEFWPWLDGVLSNGGH